MPKNLVDDLVSASPNRRSFLKKIAAATAAVSVMPIAGCTVTTALGVLPTAQAASGGGDPTTTEIQVLQFALNLEYLEAEFYTFAQYGMSITSFGIGIDGLANGANPSSGGATTGGNQVTFSNNLVFTGDIASQIGSDERAHVSLLRSALGADKIAKPNIDLNALGFGFGGESDFLKLARIFEDIGVSAYSGAAGLLTTPAIITTAARILAAEAEHVGSVRTQVARLNVPSVTLDGADLVPPPTGPKTQYLSINPANGLVATRTPGQVLYLAFGLMANVSQGGFYPTGVNGAITMSTDPATSDNLS